MTILVFVFIIFLVFLFLNPPCKNTYITKSGKTYKASNYDAAEIIDTMRLISIDLTYEIESDNEKGIQLRNTLANTTFKELIDQDDDILAWNYDKGREIGIKLYNDYGEFYSADFLIDSLFHELGHSISKTIGHGPEWKANYNFLKQDKFKNKYVLILINKTVLTN
tara:strand:+ start:4539 stop:5036 length:498 start_codon:yes stop_codon:yes gene_type:complete